MYVLLACLFWIIAMALPLEKPLLWMPAGITALYFCFKMLEGTL